MYQLIRFYQKMHRRPSQTLYPNHSPTVYLLLPESCLYFSYILIYYVAKHVRLRRSVCVITTHTHSLHISKCNVYTSITKCPLPAKWDICLQELRANTYLCTPTSLALLKCGVHSTAQPACHGMSCHVMSYPKSSLNQQASAPTRFHPPNWIPEPWGIR